MYKTPRITLFFPTIMLVCMTTLCCACSDDPSTAQDQAGGNNTQGASASTSGEVFAVALTLMANTANATSSIFTLSSLGADVVPDYGRAISVPDTVFLFGEEGSGRVFTTQAQAPIVTRYDVDESGELTPGPSLDFSNFGLSSTFSTRSIVFVEQNKAFLLDDTTLQAISFDPEAMTVGDAIAFEGVGVDGYLTNFSYNVQRRGTTFVIPVFYYNSTFSGALADSTVVLFDTETEAVRVVSDARCGAFSTTAVAPNGDIYFGSDTYSVALHLVDENAAPEGCLLRMKADDDEFDPSFMVNIRDVTGGLSGGAVIPGEGNTLWVRAFDNNLFPDPESSDGLTVFAAPVWSWWQIDLDSPEAPAVRSNFAPSAGQVRHFTTGGSSYTGTANEDFSEVTVVEMTASNAPSPGTRLIGYPSGIVKVR